MQHIIQLEPGTVLVDRYYIVKRIGGGGMGNVYLARDKRLAEASRAVKEMIGSYADESHRKKVIDDFERESKLLASLDHPAIPTIYDYFVNGGCYYLVMKYITGGDLADRLRSNSQGILGEKQVVEWGIQVADVLSYLHSQNPPIIYRDMKPANVMLDERDRVVLVDFGIARFVTNTQRNVTAIGTMGYAPPELFAGKVEARSDIYSLGATMFHLLTGRDPQDNPLLIFDFARNPRPRTINPLLSEEIDQILAKAVDHKPINRFSSAAEFKETLEAHLSYLQRGPVSSNANAVATENVQMINCIKCQGKIPFGNVFCHHCGASQKADAPVSQPAAIISPMGNTQPAASLILQLNGQEVFFVLVKDTNLVGRLDTNRGIFPDLDLTPYDKDGKISRRHAIIHRREGKIYVEDLSSTNGTNINDSDRLQPKKLYEIKAGDKVHLSDTTLQLVIGQSASAARASSPLVNKSPNAKATMIGKMPAVAAVDTPIVPQVPDKESKKSAALTPINNGDEEKLVLDNTIKMQFLTNIDFSKQVKLGQVIPLQVGLLSLKYASLGNNYYEQPLHEHDQKLTIGIPKDTASKQVTIDLYVAAPGFEVEPDIFGKLTASIVGNPTPKVFQLKAIQVGMTTITIDFYQDPEYLLSVTINTEVVQDDLS
jgi:serine/threonine-protein kinase